MFIAPFIETPYWCIKYEEYEKSQAVLYNCEVNHKYYEAKYSEIIDLNPLYTALLDIVCLAFFAYFRWFKSTWSV